MPCRQRDPPPAAGLRRGDRPPGQGSACTVGSVLPDLPPDQGATLEERMAAAVWSRDDPGPYVDTMVEAQILGVSKGNVDQFVAKGQLPWLPTGDAGESRDGGSGGRRWRSSLGRGGTEQPAAPKQSVRHRSRYGAGVIPRARSSMCQLDR